MACHDDTPSLEIKLTAGDVSRAFEMPSNPYAPIMNLKEAAQLARIAPSTLKRLVSEGKYAESVKRGKPLCRKCKFPSPDSFKTHSLRHAFCSMCAKNNISYKYALEWMGHSSSEILDLY